MKTETIVKKNIGPGDKPAVPAAGAQALPAIAGVNQDTSGTTEIDLLDVAFLLLDKAHYIILVFMAGALLFNAATFFLIRPTYRSTSKLYVVSASSDSVVNLTDLNLGTSLTADYEQLILGYPVLERVIDNLKLDMDYEELHDLISLSNPTDTRILNIAVTTVDPELSRDIANEVAKVSIEYLPETMGTNPPQLAQTAKIAEKKAGPSYPRNTLLGALLATFLYCAYLIVLYLLDDTIHTAEDMEKHFGIVPLTTIPDSDIFDRDEAVREEKKKVRFGKGRKKSA